MTTTIAPAQSDPIALGALAHRPTGRIPALDGWRGIAILLVLEEHIFRYQHRLLGHWGRSGVTIFFVLSGYLITTNLLREQAAGGIRLRRFYVRRAWRLWPCAWTYLAFVTLAYWLGSHRFAWRDALACIFFYRNFIFGLLRTLHFWSLSIEEQFYLAWPVALMLCGRRRAAWVSVVGIVAVGLYRATHWAAWSDQINVYESLHTQFHADALLMGCLFAILLFERPEFLTRSKHLLIAGTALLFLSILNMKISPTAAIASIAIFIVLSLRHNALSSILSFRPLVGLGRISYSLYVWQQIYEFAGPAHHWMFLFPAVLTAFASYVLIEKPLLALGAKLSG